jgi:putative acetyltransferase
VEVRPETPADRAAVDAVVRAAFFRTADQVAELVERIRASEHYEPELALVAVGGADVVGHVIVSWTPVEGGARDRVLMLSPLAVRPDRQRSGVGSLLTRTVLARVEERGEPAVVLEGIPAYYPRFGFEQAGPLGWSPDHPIPDEAFMVRRLPGYRDELAGRIVYPPTFDVLR